MAASNKDYKRDSNQVDKLMARVEKLVNDDGYSINRACAEVGLQPTVYYYRKRKEDAIAQGNPPAKQGKPSARIPVTSNTVRFDASHLADKDVEALKKEYAELKIRLQAIENTIVEKVLGNSKEM